MSGPARTLVAPASAPLRNGNGWAVFIVRSGRARLQQIEIGERTNTSVQIMRGLQIGDQVILFPSDDLAEGVRVRARTE